MVEGRAFFFLFLKLHEDMDLVRGEIICGGGTGGGDGKIHRHPGGIGFWILKWSWWVLSLMLFLSSSGSLMSGLVDMEFIHDHIMIICEGGTTRERI